VTVQYKDKDAPAGSMAITVKIAFLVYATIPVYILAVEFYRRAPFRVYSAGFAYVLVAILGVFTYLDFRRMGSTVDRPRPWFSFLQICLSIAIVLIVNLTAGGTVGTYYVLFLLPILIASVMGDVTMIVSTWALALAALGVSIWFKGDHAADTLVWTLAVSGAAWGGAAMAIHYAVKQFLGAIRIAGTVSQLATEAQRVELWPDGLDSCLPLLAGIMESELVQVFAGPSGSPLEEVARLDLRAGPEHQSATRARAVLTDEETRDGMRRAIDTRRVVWVGPSTFVPNRTASGMDLVIIGAHRRASRLPTASVTNSMIAAQLVGGIVDRLSLIGDLREEAVTDPLTGLVNRRGMYDVLERLLGHSARTGEPLSLAMVDIDHFKEFNDELGHLAGDAALRSLAGLLRAGVRQQDVVARFGGEEFCLLLPATGQEGAATLLRQLQAVAAKASVGQPEAALPTFSAGVAEWDHAEDRLTLIRRADTGLYRAKHSGRDTVVVEAGPMALGPGGSVVAAEEQPGDPTQHGQDQHDLHRQPDQAHDEVQQPEGDQDRDDPRPDEQYSVQRPEA
jgi:diguanylate cyclase (GGDEF)-like protein